jgi:hypothetical protein
LTSIAPRRLTRVLVRSIRVSDFAFIRQVAAHVRGYTVPPTYVLWMLSKQHPEVCLIAESAPGHPLCYLLAMSTGRAPNTLFVWQFASTLEGTRLRAARNIANRIRRIVERQGTQRICFTAVPDSGTTRAIAALAQQVLGRTLHAGAPLPKSVSPREREFYITTKGMKESS